MPVLSVDRLSFAYPDGRFALRDISFSIDTHERVGLVGPNGAGKTTLLLHLNGLLPGERTRPARARRDEEPAPPIEVLGMPVAPPHLVEIRRLVGLVFQHPDDQLFCATVAEDVGYGPRQLGFDRFEVDRRVHAALEAVGLPDYGPRGPFELSLGERRRVCLAGVLACDPAVMVLDEPSSNLDPRARRQLVRTLRPCDAALIIASHDLELVLELCNRTILLDGGRIIADGPTRTLLADERLMDAHGLEVPYSLR
jgi:cobalt/nickel transport system ATP-binding protein